MVITVREPGTKTFIDIHAYPEDYKDSTAWRIQYPGIDPFLMVKEQGEWLVADNETINIDVADAVIEGLAHAVDKK
ncbi:hypothetical protein H8S90_22025 [Olivibacter sp. SDN3]|uniref:hypothetical protein n=1 Tax=Olivibacter sp. SDN3 TaxID=2764720 RepID=UPI001651355B|nr:hypothetical protein [Olivibacter sp. SDN3]QNL49375.1 hypothetical protein H8S90_22025 [Olivibacter sp. SDN3]